MIEAEPFDPFAWIGRVVEAAKISHEDDLARLGFLFSACFGGAHTDEAGAIDGELVSDQLELFVELLDRAGISFVLADPKP